MSVPHAGLSVRWREQVCKRFTGTVWISSSRQSGSVS
jgi:hypothetical protein